MGKIKLFVAGVIVITTLATSGCTLLDPFWWGGGGHGEGGGPR
ncbi:MAG: hypothetical protein VX875_04320 [Pseudomonadota bacterium]|nr:hypothetical protein [Pseudomonadota bacterium]